MELASGAAFAKVGGKAVARTLATKAPGAAGTRPAERNGKISVYLGNIS